MANIKENMLELIGNTPIMRAANIEEMYGVSGNLFVKLENLNPAGSAKDRVGLHMIEDAENSGRLQPGSVIIEPTSGNTGIGLAAAGVIKGYKVILTMPDTMSAERINILKAYGAEVVLTPGKDGMAGSIAKAEELAAKYENSFIPGQFDNLANAEAHFLTTGPEIWNDMDGQVDCFVAGVGTGGTITGTGEFLKDKNPDIRIVAVEPASSPVLSEGTSGAHGIQGIGANFVPNVLDTSIYDEIITITDQEAIDTAKAFARSEGMLVGISSGAALMAAIKVAQRPEMACRNIVVVLPDNGDRYYSTDLFKF